MGEEYIAINILPTLRDWHPSEHLKLALITGQSSARPVWNCGVSVDWVPINPDDLYAASVQARGQAVRWG